MSRYSVWRQKVLSVYLKTVNQFRPFCLQADEMYVLLAENVDFFFFFFCACVCIESQFVFKNQTVKFL